LEVAVGLQLVDFQDSSGALDDRENDDGNALQISLSSFTSASTSRRPFSACLPSPNRMRSGRHGVHKGTFASQHLHGLDAIPRHFQMVLAPAFLQRASEKLPRHPDRRPTIRICIGSIDVQQRHRKHGNRSAGVSERGNGCPQPYGRGKDLRRRMEAGVEGHIRCGLLLEQSHSLTQPAENLTR